MNDYFKPFYERWFYSPSTFWGNIVETFRWLKYCWQRAFRGWADCDWWNLSDYLVVIILPMLKQLKENQHGYPGHGEADTPEKWDAILDKMVEGFEAGKRIADDEYLVETNADILYRRPTRDEVRSWVRKSKADQKIFNNGMKLFSKWFWALWD